MYLLGCIFINILSISRFRALKLFFLNILFSYFDILNFNAYFKYINFQSNNIYNLTSNFGDMTFFL